MARLILMFKEKPLKAIALPTGGAVTIGRRPGNDIVVENLAVSGNHARVEYLDEGVRIKDLQSKNGTFVNDRQITETVLQQNDRILIGKHVLVVDLLDEIALECAIAETVAAGNDQKPSVVSNDRTMFLETGHGRQLRGEEPPAVEEPVRSDTLQFLEGGVGSIELAGRPMVSVGRNKDADIVISGFWALLAGSPAMLINKQNGSYFLRFAGGLIRPRRNGSGIRGTVKLNHDDVVSLGPVKLQVQLRQQ